MMDILNVGININNHAIIPGKLNKSFLRFNKDDKGKVLIVLKKVLLF